MVMEKSLEKIRFWVTIVGRRKLRIIKVCLDSKGELFCHCIK